MQSEQHKDLWNRIRNFAIDDPLASVKYSDKLARNNGWSKEYTARVIEEYRKFIFLCCVLPNGASPSKPVDEAWHLHLTYTRNYWKELCAGILGREIHHFPSKGGPQENEKHIQWYNDTLDSYRQIFGQEPPDDIWIRESLPVRRAAVNDNIPGDYREWYKKYSYIFFTPFLLISILYDRIIPYQLTGPQFLVFYICLMAACIVYLLLVRAKKQKEIRSMVTDRYRGDANLYQLARFLYGREKSLRAAVVDLVDRKVLEPAKTSQFIYHSSNYTYNPGEENPLAIHLLRNVKDGDTVHFSVLTGYYDDAATYHQGLSDLSRSVTVPDRIPVAIAVLSILVGAARVMQGMSNSMPVGYLGLLCVVHAFCMIAIIYAFSGKNILQQVFVNNFKNGGQPEFQSAALAGAFVFLGLASISGMDDFPQLEKTFNRNRDNSGDGGSGSGCGSTGSGDGGGCGGGGCGGCGGGD